MYPIEGIALAIVGLKRQWQLAKSLRDFDGEV